MPSKFVSRSKLLLIIALPLLIAAVGMTWSLSQMLDDIAQKVNQQEQLRSLQAAQSALNSVVSSLEGVAVDNARWDDAVDRTYAQLDAEWVQQTWTVATSDRNYDTFFIVTSDGKTLAAGRDGVTFTVSASAYLGKTLGQLMAGFPKQPNEFSALSSLVMTNDGVSALAAAPILYFTEGRPIPAPQANYIIFLRRISPDLLANLGKSHILKDLALLPADRASGRKLVFDDWGKPLATLRWTSSNPGQAARDSSTFGALLSVLTLLGVMLPLACVHYRNMAKMEEKEIIAHRLARQDNLSGLHNRVKLIEELGQTMPKTATPDGLIVMAFIDLDGFKAVNDAFGHDIGDTLIRVVSNGLAAMKGEDALLVRLGGDEFAVLMVGRNAAQHMERLANNILKFVEAPFDIDGRMIAIGASVGLALCDEPATEISEFMRQSDIAMYNAKEHGGNQFRWFNSDLDSKRTEELAIAAELRQILAEGTLEVAYQPFVRCADQMIVGVEALARWPSSSKRKIAPDQFIHIAEEHGLIDKLGSIVLNQACVDMARFDALKVAVNFSSLQLRNSHFVAGLKETLLTTGFPALRLEVEFTESVVIQNPTLAKAAIEQLQLFGISVALDDFGMGYASVGYLREYKFDKIKLDRSLTKTLSTSALTRNIVQGTVLIAKGLSAVVIAEGVETQDDATLMRLAGCELLQGFYFGKPQPAAEIANLLNSQTARSEAVA